MPVVGRKPKPDGQRRNRVKPTYDWVEVASVPFTGGRKLPPRQPSGRPWPAWTKQWWSAVASMPHCKLWAESDWRFALDAAVVAAAFHEGDMRQAAELRAREKILGTTVDFRRDLRIRYVDPAPAVEEGSGVTSLSAYRDSLAGSDVAGAAGAEPGPEGS